LLVFAYGYVCSLPQRREFTSRTAQALILYSPSSSACSRREDNLLINRTNHLGFFIYVYLMYYIYYFLVTYYLFTCFLCAYRFISLFRSQPTWPRSTPFHQGPAESDSSWMKTRRLGSAPGRKHAGSGHRVSKNNYFAEI